MRLTDSFDNAIEERYHRESEELQASWFLEARLKHQDVIKSRGRGQNHWKHAEQRSSALTVIVMGPDLLSSPIRNPN